MRHLRLEHLLQQRLHELRAEARGLVLRDRNIYIQRLVQNGQRRHHACKHQKKKKR
jgi:hypothetical protein